jgi:hypothetical protein
MYACEKEVGGERERMGGREGCRVCEREREKVRISERVRDRARERGGRGAGGEQREREKRERKREKERERESARERARAREREWQAKRESTWVEPAAISTAAIGSLPYTPRGGGRGGGEREIFHGETYCYNDPPCNPICMYVCMHVYVCMYE